MVAADAGCEADATVVDELLQGERIVELAEPLAWENDADLEHFHGRTEITGYTILGQMWRNLRPGRRGGEVSSLAAGGT
jgi:hypothetical protein